MVEAHVGGESSGRAGNAYFMSSVNPGTDEDAAVPESLEVYSSCSVVCESFH